MFKKVGGTLLFISILSACSMAPTYVQPALPVAGNYPAAAGGHAQLEASTLGWRQFFPDQRLQALIVAALENNRDLRMATLNIEQARAQYGITAADALPNLSGDLNRTRGRTAAGQLIPGQAAVGTAYAVGVNMTAFELDFFGRVRSLKDAALANYLATEEARLSAQISLIAEVAQAYLAEQSYAQQQKLAQQTLNSRRDEYRLDQMRFKVGASSALDLRNSETLLQAARVSLATLKRQRAQATNALTLLIGKPLVNLPAAGNFVHEKIVTDIPAGLPSDLLIRRPDIRQAEQQLRAANANIGAARAAFFPRISLTAGIGHASTSLGSLFSAGSQTWSFIPQLTLPIFQGGRNLANLSLSETRKNMAIVQYEKTIQSAFREVSDALVARGTLDEQLVAQQAFLTAQQERVKLTELRYKNGIASSTDRLNAQRDLFSAQQSLIQTRQLRLSNAIDLYRALGGGLYENTVRS